MKHFSIVTLLLLVPYNLTAQTIIPTSALQEDFRVLRQAYESLHPGLYQYISRADMDRQFAQCQQNLNHDQSLAEVFLHVAQLTASIRCGHSQPNFWNQSEALQHELFDQKTCLPLYTKLVGEQLLVTHSVDKVVTPGMIIRTINGVPIGQILVKLLPLIRGDGSSTGKRRTLLAITGQKFECFDIFYTLLYPLQDGTFHLGIFDGHTHKPKQVVVSPLTRQQRAALMASQYPATVRPLGELAWLNRQTALLRINSMVDWNTPFNLKRFIDSSFQAISQQKAQTLIIDIRQLEGGNDQYGRQIAAHLLTHPIVPRYLQNTWAYTSIDSAFNRYITNGAWANEWKYRPAADFMVTPRGQYRYRTTTQADTLQPTSDPFRGRVYLLTSAVNSSAGFLLAQLIKDHKLATLVGQPTGGNQKGITGGALFFVRLPNSGIEVDVPLIGTGYDVSDQLPDAGILPDVSVKPSVEAQARGIDQEIGFIKKELPTAKQELKMK